MRATKRVISFLFLVAVCVVVGIGAQHLKDSTRWSGFSVPSSKSGPVAVPNNGQTASGSTTCAESALAYGIAQGIIYRHESDGTTTCGVNAEQATQEAHNLPISDQRVPNYQRVEDFGPAWADVDHNGCDTRNDILHRDLTATASRSGTHDCVIISGELKDPYTDTNIAFRKQQASEVQIDHMVPLGYAWNHGASTWSFATREAFANDPSNLTAVQGQANQEKSDSGPAEWLPSNGGYQCLYAARFVAVATHYHMTVTEADQRELASILVSCH